MGAVPLALRVELVVFRIHAVSRGSGSAVALEARKRCTHRTQLVATSGVLGCTVCRGQSEKAEMDQQYCVGKRAERYVSGWEDTSGS